MSRTQIPNETAAVVFAKAAAGTWTKSNLGWTTRVSTVDAAYLVIVVPDTRPDTAEFYLAYIAGAESWGGTEDLHHNADADQHRACVSAIKNA